MEMRLNAPARRFVSFKKNIEDLVVICRFKKKKFKVLSKDGTIFSKASNDQWLLAKIITIFRIFRHLSTYCRYMRIKQSIISI